MSQKRLIALVPALQKKIPKCFETVNSGADFTLTGIPGTLLSRSAGRAHPHLHVCKSRLASELLSRRRGGWPTDAWEVPHVQHSRPAAQRSSRGFDEVQNGRGRFTPAPRHMDLEYCQGFPER